MSHKGMTGVEMWNELKNLHSLLDLWVSDLDLRTRRRGKIIKDMAQVAMELGQKIELQAGQQHAD